MTVRSAAMSLARTFHGDAGESAIREARQVVQRGGVIAMPTDSVYALGACINQEAAVRRVCDIKGQRDQKPILALIGDRAQLDMLVAAIPPAARVLMDRFWPGPVTIVVPALPNIPIAVTAGTGTIGVRMPAHSWLMKLLQDTGPLTGTSANRSGLRPGRSAREVEASLGGDVDLILDGGPATVGQPSTVVETTNVVRVLREGPVGLAAIEAVLEQEGIALG